MKMTMLDEYVEARIHDVFLDLAEDISSGKVTVDDPNIAAGIPMALFQVNCAIVKAWQAFLDEMPGAAIIEQLDESDSGVLIDFYCPACGEYNQVQWQWYDVLAPGGNEDTEVTCPNCGKRWRIEIAFMEIDDDIQSP